MRKVLTFLFSRHTFGANKDRFKDSVYGRLDLKAEIPGTLFDAVYHDVSHDFFLGPCSYEVHTTSIRPSTSPEAPGVAR